LGVPALVAAAIGGLMLAEVTHRQSYSRDLLTNGVETVASSVQISVGERGTIAEPEVVFRTQDGREVKIALVDAEVNNTEGMAPGAQTPAAGTRYAPPLKIVYQPWDPSFALASVDARAWAADRRTPHCRRAARRRRCGDARRPRLVEPRRTPARRRVVAVVLRGTRTTTDAIVTPRSPIAVRRGRTSP
jgi:hypothetical protein